MMYAQIFNTLINFSYELLGFITLIISVIFLKNEDKQGWVWSIVSSVFYMLLFFNKSMEWNAWLQIGYIFMSVYGWILWKDVVNSAIISITDTDVYKDQEIDIVMILSVILVILLLADINILTSTDIYTTVLCVVASIGLWYKVYESWMLFVIANLIYIAFFIYSDMYITAGAYLFLLWNANSAFKLWKGQYINVSN